jgi:DNA-binding beta-propeller fold protein YncE
MRYFSTYQKLSKKVVISLCVTVTFFSLICLPIANPSAFGRTDAPNAESSADVSSEKVSTQTAERRANSRSLSVIRVLVEDYQGDNLSYPSKLFVDPVKREIYVTDSGNGRILVYTHDFYPLLSIGEDKGIAAPVGLTVDRQGYLFVAQSEGKKRSASRISLFDPALRWKKDILFAGFPGAKVFSPKNLAVSEKDLIYVAGDGHTGVVVLNREGKFLHFLTPSDRLGKGEEEKVSICDVTIDRAGHIYLLSEDMGRVYVYDKDETFIRKFGKKGGSTGKLSRPRGLAVDEAEDRIYVVDYMRHSASVYSEQGRFLFEFGGKGWSKGWFQFPSDVALDASGNVLVADTFNNRVQVFTVE